VRISANPSAHASLFEYDRLYGQEWEELMWRLGFSLMVVAGFGLASALPAAAEYGAASCRYNITVDWKHLDSQQPSHEDVFQALVECEKGLHPVSGGIRLEGVQSDLSWGRNWKLVKSEPHEMTKDAGKQQRPLTGWACWLMREEGVPADKTPDKHGWCVVMCCP
jgi:hypothetical protein